jgi:CTP synthase
MAKKKKYVFVVGGVMSSVGKGVTAASVGAILQARGYKITNIKCDMYVNIDAGTIRPTEHGEVFVGEDGIEADQDLGNYERFTGTPMSSVNYVTTGQVYQEVIRRERNLEYDGEDVEVVPDVPNEIIRRIKLATKHNNADVTIVELGGTVGEYQVLLFLEAARIMKVHNGEDVAFILVSYLPLPKHIGEMKTKPTQYAVRTLNAAGILADFIVARGEQKLDKKRQEILAKVCNLIDGTVVAAPDVYSIYDIPMMFHEQGFDTRLLRKLGLKPKKSDFRKWKAFGKQIRSLKKTVKIGIVGKYFGTGDFTLADSYISVIEAAKHAAWTAGAEPELTWVDSEDFENNPKKIKSLAKFDAILVPGGFGCRGVEGIIRAIKYARESKVPYLGLCYGMQLASIEFVRNVLGKKNATTVEMDPKTKEPVIHINPGQAKNVSENRYGGTMRLGAYDCTLRKGTKTAKAYGTLKISERHRHRYEFNNDYRKMVDKAGLQIVGINPESDLVEIVELKNHPFFVGTQFHPEFKSQPMNPHPLFREFVKAALRKKI